MDALCRYVRRRSGDVQKLTKAYCDGMQTTEGEADGWGKDSVNTMVKHWPGGGTGEAGRDAHYAFGQFAVYPTGNFEEHLKPFTEAAFHLDGPTDCASAVMPYYTVSYGVDKKNGKNVGNSYSEYLIKDLLRGKYEFKGIVCTDWGITQDPEKTIEGFGSRCYGVQDMTEAERCLLAITNGVDQFGGNSESGPIVEAYKIGCEKYGEKAMRERMELSAKRLLINIFHCGLFEDPYLDPEESAKIVGCEEFCRHGYEAQQKSIVLLKNSAKRAPEGQKGVLPLKKGLKVYIPERKIGPSKAFFRIDLPAKPKIRCRMDCRPSTVHAWHHRRRPMWRWYLSKARHATRIPPKILRTAATDICRLHCSTARIRRKSA